MSGEYLTSEERVLIDQRNGMDRIGYCFDRDETRDGEDTDWPAVKGLIGRGYLVELSRSWTKSSQPKEFVIYQVTDACLALLKREKRQRTAKEAEQLEKAKEREQLKKARARARFLFGESRMRLVE